MIRAKTYKVMHKSTIIVIRKGKTKKIIEVRAGKIYNLFIFLFSNNCNIICNFNHGEKIVQ